MRRVGLVLAALALPLGLSANGAAVARDASPSAAKQRTDTSSISIDNLVPATIPTKGAIVLTGTLHNGSGEIWHHLSLTPQTSYYPRRTSADIENAASLDPSTVQLGSTMVDLSEQLPDLAPGASTQFTLQIPRAKMHISGESGAYWLGVVPHSDEQLQSSLTARTFLPLLPTVNKKARMDVALVLPLRQSPLRTSTGGLSDPAGFNTALSPHGRLGRIATFGEAAASRPLTWLVDPALLDLADDAAHGTTTYALGLEGTALPHPAPLPTPSGSATSTPTASGSPSATPTPGTAGSAAQIAARINAGSWLSSITTMLKATATFELPYADPAIAPLVATGHADLLTWAVDLSTESMTARGLPAQPAVAPPSGRVTESEWSALAAGQTVFINASSGTSRSMESDGRTLVVASPASSGGLGPSSPASALNLRQRLLAEAAVRIGTPGTTNVTVVLPANWDPGASAGITSFFPQLTRPWLAFTGLPSVTSGTATLSKALPSATSRQRANLRGAQGVEAAAARLATVLATTQNVTSTLTRQLNATALSTISYDSANAPNRYRLNATNTVASVDRLLASVRVEGTQFVTLSGSSGVITVALHNGLNQPIRVGLRQTNLEPGSTVTVDPVAAVTLDPGERSTLRVHLTARRVSVQEVTLTAVTTQGLPIGTPLRFTLRSSSVGAVVWAITIAIVLVLVLLVGRRLRTRLRGRRRSA